MYYTFFTSHPFILYLDTLSYSVLNNSHACFFCRIINHICIYVLTCMYVYMYERICMNVCIFPRKKKKGIIGVKVMQRELSAIRRRK